MSDNTTDRGHRLNDLDRGKWDERSLVGSYFHGDADRQWQGVVVAEPAPGLFLVELFEWLIGSATHQCLVPIADMAGWRFYDTSEWMCNCSRDAELRWERERGAAADPVATSDANGGANGGDPAPS